MGAMLFAVLFGGFLLTYLIFYKNNYADNQNERIIGLLTEKGAKKYENLYCSLTVLLSFNTEPYDVYRTENSIVLVKNYNALFGQKSLQKRAETYLVIIKEEGLPKELFTNYLIVDSREKKENSEIIKGDLYSKSPFTKSFVYTANVSLRIPLS